MLAGLSAALSVTAHGLAGGGLPHPLTTLLLATLVGWVATATAHRTHGTLGILAVLGTGQLATHTLLTLISGHGLEGGEGPAMLAGHVLATAATAGLLAHAETMLAAAASAARWLLRPVTSPVQAPPATPAPTRLPRALPDDAPRVVVDILLRRVHGRRGPPVLS
ncbi:hypothetical protein BJF85_05290 [Saccharomonospora sp. CUA-673]|nr:hypothetical protein BJF85_05290 [Saccharomonospora sp. CUA-673]